MTSQLRMNSKDLTMDYQALKTCFPLRYFSLISYYLALLLPPLLILQLPCPSSNTPSTSGLRAFALPVSASPWY